MHGHRLTTNKLVFKIGENFKITIWIENFYSDYTPCEIFVSIVKLSIVSFWK